MVQRNTLFKKLKSLVHEFDPNAKIILFGSRARGNHRKDSDWDFMILTKNKFDWQQQDDIRNKIYYEIELKTDAILYATIEQQQYWDSYKNADPLLVNIAKEGIEI